MTGVADRVGLSTITFRFRPLAEALGLIERLGASEIDLGAIPDVTDHVPVPFEGDPGAVARHIDEHRLRCGAVNADVGDLNDPAWGAGELEELVRPLVGLAAACGAALIVPCGRADHEPFTNDVEDLERIAGNLRLIAEECRAQGVRLLAEALHHNRFIHRVEAAERLLAMVDPADVGLLFDVSHVVASQDDPVAWAAQRCDRVERVHLRDAVAGNLNIGIGRGEVDFAGLIETHESNGFEGSYVLELETHDIREEDREADAARSRAEIVGLLDTYWKEKWHDNDA